MPLLDAYIPAGALEPDAERELMDEITDALLEHEGVDPSNETARQIAWVFVHRPEVYVAGAPADAPRYRFVCQVPEGQYDAERRAGATKAITEAVARAERGRYPDPEARVWVFTFEVPDGTWGALGRTVRLPDIAGAVMGERGRQYGERRLAERRRAEAEALLRAARAEAPA
jgi:phenylpyruvate tautomerase PptA (4-oxalocrotonate tautomerase family)